MGVETKMKKAIFFDLYGTLIDIRTDEVNLWVYSELSRYLSYHSVKIAPDELRDAYFERIGEHLGQSTEPHPEVDVYEVFHEIMHRYGNKGYPRPVVIDTAMLFRSLTMRHFCLFPDIIDTLAHLSKRYKMAIISDAQWVFAEPEIEVSGLDQFFKFRVLSSCFGFKKPDTRLFKWAMEKLKVRPEQSVYIGDNPSKDLIGSKRAGMKCILFRSECLEYEDITPDGCFFDYSVVENIINAIL